MAGIMQVVDLKKSYGNVAAVAGVSFEIPEGSCFGLLGPNGAGKTTTIEIMEGILKPDGGRVLFQGRPIDQHFKEKVGIQFQSTSLPEFITVRETIDLFSAFYPSPRSISEIIKLCSLEDILDRDNRKLSGGQRQRMLLAIALIPRPAMVFLDEPTTGLDPQARRNFWELIRGIKAEGATVLLTTHYMDEAQELCDQIGIMDHGHLLELDRPEALLSRHFSGVLVKLPKDAGKAGPPPGVLGAIEREGNWEIQTTDLERTLNELVTSKSDLSGLGIHKPDLEDLFIKLTGSSLRV